MYEILKHRDYRYHLLIYTPLNTSTLVKFFTYTLPTDISKAKGSSIDYILLKDDKTGR